VARLEAMCVLLAYAVNEGWLVHHMGMKSVFHNGDLR
jgi:hypothetical protein